MIGGLIFDFDGLILDSETALFRAWESVYHDYGCTLPLEQWSAALGMGHMVFDPFAHLERLLGCSLNREEVQAVRRTRNRQYQLDEVVLPGVREYLDAAHARHLLVGVASSSPHRWVDEHLQRLGLRELFHAVRCADDVAEIKPAPDLYHAALHALGLTPAEAIAFEDSPPGVCAAKRAGLYCVAVPNPLSSALAFTEADLVLSSLAELPLAQLLLRL